MHLFYNEAVNTTSSEEDLKKFLKSLLQDKKEGGERGALRHVFEEKEREVETLRTQMEKVKPALKKLLEELKAAREEALHAQEQCKELSSKEERLLSLENEKREIEKTLTLQFEQALAERLKESSEREREKKEALEGEKRALEIRCKKLNDDLLEKEQQRHESAKSSSRLEGERTELMTKLADGVSQLQRQSETIKELREETERLKLFAEQKALLETQMEHLKQQLAEKLLDAEKWRSAADAYLFDSKKKENALKGEEALLKNKIAALTAALEKKEAEGDTEALLVAHAQKMEEQRFLHEEQLSSLNDEKQQLEERLLKSEDEKDRLANEKREEEERLLTTAYGQLRELLERKKALIEQCTQLFAKTKDRDRLKSESGQLHAFIKTLKARYHEKELEIRKAHQHLAKKVKETALACNLAEQRSKEIAAQHEDLTHVRGEVEKLKSQLHLQRLHDEKARTLAREKYEEIEKIAKRWEESYLICDLQKQKCEQEIETLLGIMAHIRTLLPQKLDHSMQATENE